MSKLPGPAMRPPPPPNSSTLVKNLRFLELDKHTDWPSITIVSFSGNDSIQNQKTRVRGAEWILYKLFEIWDFRETQNKLRPFFPPFEPLQSLNLRAALFRCLNELKKTGILGREVILRKTMLDDCKGDKFVDVLVAFSTAVLRKVVEDDKTDGSITKRLALATKVTAHEAKSMLPLVVAHRASLTARLRRKSELKSTYLQLGQNLDSRATQLARRREQLKQKTESCAGKGGPKQSVQRLKEKVEAQCSGDPRWMEIIIHGDKHESDDPVLERSFQSVWSRAGDGTLEEIDIPGTQSLLQDLENRVSGQKARLQRWKEIREGLMNSRETLINIDRKNLRSERVEVLDQATQMPQSSTTESMERQTKAGGRPQIATRRSGGMIVGHHEKLTTTTQIEEADGHESKKHKLQKWTRRADNDYEATTQINARIQSSNDLKNTRVSPTPSNSPCRGKEQDILNKTASDRVRLFDRDAKPDVRATLSLQSPGKAMPKDAEKQIQASNLNHKGIDGDFGADSLQSRGSTGCLDQAHEQEELAGKILSSIINAEPSPMKPNKKPSLVERTRMSMAFAGQTNHDHANIIISPQVQICEEEDVTALEPVKEYDRRITLLERTRQSMALLPAASRGPLDSSRPRQSRTYPTNQFETPKKQQSSIDESEVSTPTQQIFSQDTDYASVFKSRPKIALSPITSPLRDFSVGYEDVGVEEALGQLIVDEQWDTSPLGKGMSIHAPDYLLTPPLELSSRVYY
ncbi:hypothetical protein MMC24_003315 [Lignoscripta atroalba]|nr:hypothetical protein [Lignoscripta atroalba]